jgi:hypothetical protein
MTIGDVIKKSILPLAFMVFWFWMTKTIMKVSGQTDWFWWIFIAGLPFGIHKMRLILIPRGMDWYGCIKCHHWSIDRKYHDSSVCDQSDIRFYTVYH